MKPRASRLSLAAICLGLCFAHPASPQEWTYPMQPGDTVWSLSHRFLKDPGRWLAVSQRNQVVADREMPPGTKLRFPVEWLRTEQAPVQVIKVKGEVRGRLGSAAEERALKPGMTLYAGDELSTGEDANATLQFADGTRLLVQGDSRLQLVSARLIGGEVSDAEVRLQDGQSESAANPNKQPGANFRVTTPVASAAVRGTEFRVGAEGQQAMQVSVTGGRVGVENRLGTTELKTRQGTVARAGKPPAPARPLLPGPDLSPIAAVQRHLPLVLEWKPVPKAHHYRVQVAPSSAFETLLQDRVVTAPKVRLSDLPDGDYFLRVRPVDGDNIQGLDSDRAFKVDAQPEPPFIQTPAANASVRQDVLKFRWTQPSGIGRYRLVIAAQDRPQPPLFDQQLTATEHLPTPPLPPGRYQWQIASIDADREGPLSRPVAFTVRPTPELAPPETQGETLTFRWRGEPDERFEIQMADDWHFGQVFDQAQVTGPEATLKKPPPGLYYLRTRGFDADGQPEPWSAPQKTTLDPPGWVYPALGVGALLILLL